MCTAAIGIGIAIGAATGAAGAAITGGDPLQGALMGGVMGGIGGHFGAVGAESWGTEAFGKWGANILTPGVTYGGMAGMATASLASSVLIGKLTPGTPEYSNAYQQQQQQYNSQPLTVTGSGGKQAAFSLAESVRRAKKRKLTQEDVSDLSIDTSSFASEGLQFA